MSTIRRTEWRVESEDTEDEFDTDEHAAREWLATCNERAQRGDPHWLPATLMRRVVTITATDWEATS